MQTTIKNNVTPVIAQSSTVIAEPTVGLTIKDFMKVLFRPDTPSVYYTKFSRRMAGPYSPAITVISSFLRKNNLKLKKGNSTPQERTAACREFAKIVIQFIVSEIKGRNILTTTSKGESALKKHQLAAKERTICNMVHGLYTFMETGTEAKFWTKTISLSASRKLETTPFKIGEYTLMIDVKDRVLLNRLDILCQLASKYQVTASTANSHVWTMLSNAATGLGSLVGLTEKADPAIATVGNLSTSISNLVGHVPSFMGSVDGLTGSINDITSKLSKVIGVASSVIDVIAAIKETISSWCKHLNDNIAIIVTDCIGMFLHSYVNIAEWKTHVMIGVSMLILKLGVGKKIADAIRQIFLDATWLESSNAKSHSVVDDFNQVWHLGSTAIMMLATVTLLSDKGTELSESVFGSFSGIMTSCTKYKKKLTSFRAVLDGLKSFAETSFGFMYRIFTGQELRDDAGKLENELQIWLDAVAKCESTNKAPCLGLNGVLAKNDMAAQYRRLYDRRVETLYAQGQTLSMKLDKLKDLALGVKAIVTRKLNFLATEHKAAMDKFMDRGIGVRKEPLSVVLCGPPGHGKTTAVNMLQQLFFMLRGFTTDEELDFCERNEIYSHGGHDYYNGYKNQLIYFYDDVGQIVTGPGTPDPFYNEFIHLRNTAPYNLSMAALEDKNMHFTSEFMLMTTNCALKDKYSVADHGAFDRRIDFKLFVSVDPDVLEFPAGTDANYWSKEYLTRKTVGTDFLKKVQMGKISPAKVQAKYGSLVTEKIYRFFLMDQHSTSGVAPLKSKKINGTVYDTDRWLTWEEVQHFIIETDSGTKTDKDLNRQMILKFREQKRSELRSVINAAKTHVTLPVIGRPEFKMPENSIADMLDGHAIAHNASYALDLKYCWAGCYCADSECQLIHSSYIKTWRDAFAIISNSHVYEVGKELVFAYSVDFPKPMMTAEEKARFDQQALFFLNTHFKTDVFSTGTLGDTFMSLKAEYAYRKNAPAFLKKVGWQKPKKEGNGPKKTFVSVRETVSCAFKELYQIMDHNAQRFLETPTGQITVSMGKLLLPIALIVATGIYYYRKGVNTGASASKTAHVLTASQKQRRKDERAARTAAIKEEATIVKPILADATEHELKVFNEFANNTYRMYTTVRGENADGSNGVHTPLGTCTFLKGQMFVTNSHVMHSYAARVKKDKGTCLILKNRVKPTGMLIRQCDFESCDVVEDDQATDVTFVAVKKHTCVPNHRTLEKYLITREDILSKFGNATLRIPVGEDDKPAPIRSTIKGTHSGVMRFDRLVNPVMQLSSLLSSVEGAPGNSGSPEICLPRTVMGPLSQVHNAKFLGIYSGVVTLKGVTTGFVLPVAKEYLPAAEEQLGKQLRFAQEDCKVLSKTDYYDGLELAIEGSYATPLRCATKSDLVPAPLQNVIRVCPTKPAYLKGFKNDEGKKINPRRNAILKYGTPNHYIEPEEAEQAVADTLDYAGKVLDPDYQRTFTTYEAVYGVVSMAYVDAINSSSSCGHIGRAKFEERYAHMMESLKEAVSQRTGKPVENCGINNAFYKEAPLMTSAADIENVEAETQRVCELFEEYEAEFLKKLENNERHVVYWEDQLKDEKRPIAKVDVGKTRMFNCAADVCYLVLVRKYTLGFAGQAMLGKTKNGFTVGINPYSKDWGELYTELTKFGEDNVFAGDFSAFDSSHNIVINSRIMKHINRVFYPQDAPDSMANRIREHLWHEIYHSVHINESDIYTWQKGMPSGNPMTTLINCIVNCASMRLCFYRRMKDLGRPQHATAEYFNQHVVHESYGDDSLTAVSDEIKDVFNQVVVSKYMPKFGFAYTDELKGDAEDMVPLRNVSTVNFLKRKFVKCPRRGIICAPIAEETIYGMLDWVRGYKNYDSQAFENMKNALREAALHDEEFFELFYNDLYRECKHLYPDLADELPRSYWGLRYRISNEDYQPY